MCYQTVLRCAGMSRVPAFQQVEYWTLFSHWQTKQHVAVCVQHVGMCVQGRMACLAFC